MAGTIIEMGIIVPGYGYRKTYFLVIIVLF